MPTPLQPECGRVTKALPTTPRARHYPQTEQNAAEGGVTQTRRPR